MRKKQSNMVIELPWDKDVISGAFMLYGMSDEREDRKQYVYENFINILKRGHRNKSLYCEFYDQAGDLCITTKYIRNNINYQFEDKGRDLFSRLIIHIKQSCIKKQLKGDYDLHICMKAPDGKEVLLYKERIACSDCFDCMDENIGWDVHYDVEFNLWSKADEEWEKDSPGLWEDYSVGEESHVRVSIHKIYPLTVIK